MIFLLRFFCAKLNGNYVQKSGLVVDTVDKKAAADEVAALALAKVAADLEKAAVEAMDITDIVTSNDQEKLIRLLKYYKSTRR